MSVADSSRSVTKTAGVSPSLKSITSIYAKTDFRNRTFEEYYKRQEIVPAEEWNQFLDAMKRDLPTTFRITGNKR